MTGACKHGRPPDGCLPCQLHAARLREFWRAPLLDMGKWYPRNVVGFLTRGEA